MKKRIMLFAIVMALMLGMLTVSAAADDAGAWSNRKISVRWQLAISRCISVSATICLNL